MPKVGTLLVLGNRPTQGKAQHWRYTMKEFLKGRLKLAISLMAAVACTDDSTEMERPDFGKDRSKRSTHDLRVLQRAESQLKTSILNDTAANLWMQYEDYLRYGYGWGMDDVGVAEGRARVL